MIERIPIPAKARNRDCVAWRLNIHRELTNDELTAVASIFLTGTTHHYMIAADVYPGITQLMGDYWAPKGRGKDLAAVAKRWQLVQDRLPEVVVDAVLEYRVPSTLLDEVEFDTTEVNPALGLQPE